MHIDFALPVAGDLEAGFKEWQGKAANSVMDYSFHMAVTTWNEKVSLARPRRFLASNCKPFPVHIWSADRTGCEGHGDADGGWHQQLQVFHGVQGRVPGLR